MRFHTCSRDRHMAALLLTSILSIVPAASAAEAVEPPAEATAPDTVPDALRRPPFAAPPAESPDAACFRAARSAAWRVAPIPADAAYTCDLAVQMARDSRSPPVLAAALANRALVLAAEGRLEPALTDLDSAAAQAPANAAIHGNRGNLLLRMGRASDALIAHDRAVELAPGDPAAYVNRAFSHRAVGEPALAAEDVARARTLMERRQTRLSPGETAGPDGRRAR